MKLAGRALDITGQQFGKLTAFRPLRRSRQGIVWQCRCECGKQIQRTAGLLREVVRTGGWPRCPACAPRPRARETKRPIQAISQGHLRASWTEHRRLYSLSSLAAMADDIDQELWRESLVVPDDPDVMALQQQIERHGYVSIADDIQSSHPLHEQLLAEQLSEQPSELPCPERSLRLVRDRNLKDRRWNEQREEREERERLELEERELEERELEERECLELKERERLELEQIEEFAATDTFEQALVRARSRHAAWWDQRHAAWKHQRNRQLAVEQSRKTASGSRS